MNKKGIKNIIFDLGGVILNIDYSLTQKAFFLLGISEEQMAYSQSTQSHFFDDLETGKITPHQFRDEVRKMSFLGLTDNEIDGAWNALILDLPEQRIALLKKLKEEYRTFLLSNTNEIHYNAYSKSIKEQNGLDGLDSLFEKMYLSHEVGLRKPNAAIFNLVLQENGLKPEETLFVDDSEQHIKSAVSIGMRTHWLTTGSILNLFPTSNH